MRGTAFSRACEERRWARPAVFLMVYATVATRLGEPQEVTARQFHRWRQPGPPCPQPSAQRVLEEMFGTRLHRLGFDVPEHRRRDTAAPPAGAAEPPPAALRFAVLGPVRVRRGEETLAAGRPQERALLCALLLRRGHTATAQELMDAVWGGKPPRSALATLRTYAFQLRRTLGRALVSDSGGYALHVPPEALDLVVCEGYEAQARSARAAGDPPRARKLLRKALALWDGEPLGGVPGLYAQAQRARLAEWRLTLVQTRLELDLELGNHTEALAELTALSVEHPLRERLRALQMLALYRAGRQAEALRVYTDTRHLLAEELGVDPGPELTELYQNVLCASPAVARPPAPRRRPPAGDTAPYVSPRPAQLPAELADFTGRATLVHRLTEQLSCAQGAVMPVLAVRGLGGVGKTALALRVAHAARGHFPEGQLYTDLLGPGPGAAHPGAVLGAFLRALGVPAAAVPAGTSERAALYRSTLAGRRVLVLLDNALDGTQIRPLLPGAPGCAALVTSRARLADLDGTRPLDLEVMSPEEALTLFGHAIGEERAEAEPAACRDTVAACGFLPLAIRIAAARLSARPAWTVFALAARLADERGRLDELRMGDLTVTSCFAPAYGRLRPDQARAFRLLALADGPDLSLETAAALLGLDRCDPAVEPLLDSLVDSALLESPAPGRYRYHDLVRLYARQEHGALIGKAPGTMRGLGRASATG